MAAHAHSDLPPNARVGLGLFCTVTSVQKGHPFEVALPAGGAVRGVILADQIRSLDWRARQARRAGHVEDDTLEEVVGKILTLIE